MNEMVRVNRTIRFAFVCGSCVIYKHSSSMKNMQEKEANAFDDCPIWLAHWGVSKPFAVKNMKIWQYGTVTIRGVKFDANYGYFDEDKLIGQTIEKSSKVKIKAQAKYKAPGARYTEGANVPYGVRTKQYDVISVATFDNVECALLGGINSWVATKYLERV